MQNTTKTRGQFDYGYAFRQLAEAARKSGDVSAKHYNTGTNYGEAFEEVAEGAQKQGQTGRRNNLSNN